MELSSKVVAVEGDPPLPFILVENFRHERKVRLAVRVALASIVRPLTAMLPVSDTFDVVEKELAALRVWFESQVKKQLEEKK